MTACEKCWKDGGSTAAGYQIILEARKNNPCTLKEQAGHYWDEDRQMDRRVYQEDKV